MPPSAISTAKSGSNRGWGTGGQHARLRRAIRSSPVPDPLVDDLRHEFPSPRVDGCRVRQHRPVDLECMIGARDPQLVDQYAAAFIMVRSALSVPSLRFDFAAGQLPVSLPQDSVSGVSLEVPGTSPSRDGCCRPPPSGPIDGSASENCIGNGCALMGSAATPGAGAAAATPACHDVRRRPPSRKRRLPVRGR